MKLNVKAKFSRLPSWGRYKVSYYILSYNTVPEPYMKKSYASGQTLVRSHDGFLIARRKKSKCQLN